LTNIRSTYKIIHIVRQFSPAIGGLENFVKSLAKEQIADGLDVEVITLNRIFHQNDKNKLDESEIIEGIKVTRLPYKGSYKYPFAPGVIRKITTADIVHVHAVDFFADFLSLSKFIHKKPLVLSTHGGFFHTTDASFIKKFFFHLITRYTLKNYQAVVACSENDWWTFDKIRKKKLFLVENGVDVHKFKSSVVKVPNKQLVFLGRFSKNKRIDQLIIFFTKLVAIDSGYQLLIIGKDWDNSLAQINSLIQKNDISAHVTVLCNLDDHDIKTHLDNAAFIVSASEYEGFGLSIIEGMSAGLIPICSDIPSFTKIIMNAGVGINLDFSDDNQAPDIDAFINNQLAEYSQNTENARAAAKAYSWSIKAGEFASTYETILGNNYREIQGVKIDVKGGNEVVEYLDRQINQNNKTILAFANAHTINTANKDREFKKILASFLVLNDGIGLEIASKIKYRKRFIENLNGTDFVPKYLGESKAKLKIFLLGATEDTVSKTFGIWTHAYKQHSWCGYHNGYFDKDNCLSLLEEIRNSGANTLIVAMGNPVQEKWIWQYKDQMDVDLAIGVGALFDFVAGKVERAPDVIQKLKLEWAYRLLQEPRRLWRRYIIGNAVFLLNCFKEY
jgi:alpha-1,3-mannosyltransferase